MEGETGGERKRERRSGREKERKERKETKRSRERDRERTKKNKKVSLFSFSDLASSLGYRIERAIILLSKTENTRVRARGLRF